jgi:hypothetical protein
MSDMGILTNMGIGKNFGSQGRIAVQRSGYFLVSNSVLRKLDFQVCYATAISPSVQLIEAGEYCEILSLQPGLSALFHAPTSGGAKHTCSVEWHLECTVEVCSQPNC